MLIGVDIGGTFTDIVFLNNEDKTIEFLKVFSTPGRLEDGVVNGLRSLAERTGLQFEQVWRIVHGTTVATNALLEGKWARTALITTAGFRDIIEIGRQNRPNIYDLLVERPRPIVSRDLTFEAPERLDYQGRVIQPLDEDAVERIAEQMSGRGVESVAVSLLFSYTNPDHERSVQSILSSKLDVPITLSSEVLPEFREYERTMTVVVNAALRPVIGSYMERLEGEGRKLGLNREWHIMQSNAGIISSRSAQNQPVRIILSGPAAGVEGARFIGKQAGLPNVITLDMGGTSCDVSLVNDGNITATTEGCIAGYPIKVPMVDVHTIGAGGGSIAWIDKGSALRVGPRSAGADPGPVCYGKGGYEPTVTDAQLALGRLNQDSPVGEMEGLDLEAARKAIREMVSEPLGMSLEEAAQGILAVAEANMERAIRVISVERGHDPRQFALLAFGGAGPLHGASLAARLGIGQVLVPETAGVLSALGLLQTDLAHEYVQSVVQEVGKLRIVEVIRMYDLLKEQGRREVLQDGVPEERIRYQPSLDMRYVGQSHELNLRFPCSEVTPGGFSRLVQKFHEEHQQVYGHASPGEPVELVNLRLRVVGLMERIEFRRVGKKHTGGVQPSSRQVHFPKEGWVETRVLERDSLAVGVLLEGPAIIEGSESTVAIPPGWQAFVDEFGNLIMKAEGATGD